jgi:hypothetical protein
MADRGTFLHSSQNLRQCPHSPPNQRTTAERVKFRRLPQERTQSLLPHRLPTTDTDPILISWPSNPIMESVGGP